MVRYIAFLRALNVGGHTVKMDTLRSIFTDLKFDKVETFIASGNVIFETKAKDPSRLRETIETHLREVLGYEVATFLRTDEEVAGIARYQPFPEETHKTASAFVVGFLDEPMPPSCEQSVLKFKTEIDDFHINGRELYWLCQTKQSESTFFKVSLEKMFKIRMTYRGMNTIQRLAARYPPSK